MFAAGVEKVEVYGMSFIDRSPSTWLFAGIAGCVLTSFLLGAATTLLLIGGMDRQETEVAADPQDAGGPVFAAMVAPDEATARTAEPQAARSVSAAAPQAATPAAVAATATVIAAPEAPAPIEVAAPPAAADAGLPPPPPPVVIAADAPGFAVSPPPEDPAPLVSPRTAAALAALSPSAYWVQAGSFLDPANADAFVLRITEQGLPGASVPRGRWTVASVGPFVSAADAAGAAAKIRRAFEVEPIIRRVEPTE